MHAVLPSFCLCAVLVSRSFCLCAVLLSPAFCLCAVFVSLSFCLCAVLVSLCLPFVYVPSLCRPFVSIPSFFLRPFVSVPSLCLCPFVSAPSFCLCVPSFCLCAELLSLWQMRLKLNCVRHPSRVLVDTVQPLAEHYSRSTSYVYDRENVGCTKLDHFRSECDMDYRIFNVHM